MHCCGVQSEEGGTGDEGHAQEGGGVLQSQHIHYAPSLTTCTHCTRQLSQLSLTCLLCLCVLLPQVQRSLRRHDTQLTRILDDDEINAGKTKKSKAKPAATASTS